MELLILALGKPLMAAAFLSIFSVRSVGSAEFIEPAAFERGAVVPGEAVPARPLPAPREPEPDPPRTELEEAPER